MPRTHARHTRHTSDYGRYTLRTCLALPALAPLPPPLPFRCALLRHARLATISHHGHAFAASFIPVLSHAGFAHGFGARHYTGGSALHGCATTSPPRYRHGIHLLRTFHAPRLPFRDRTDLLASFHRPLFTPGVTHHICHCHTYACCVPLLVASGNVTNLPPALCPNLNNYAHDSNRALRVWRRPWRCNEQARDAGPGVGR